MSGIQAQHLRTYIIRPALLAIDLWSQAAENLLLGTAAHESKSGTFLKQMNGPALGIYQIEPTTFEDIQDYITANKSLQKKVTALLSPFDQRNGYRALTYHLIFSTAIARLIYLRAPQALPCAQDIPGLAQYWKMHYNTPLGRGTVAEFIAHYPQNEKEYVTYTD